MVIHSLRLLVCILFCLLQVISSQEQTVTGSYSITNYNSDNALPQNSINGMAFDKNGFLWLATKKGIVRFDGKNFREYNSENCPVVTEDEYSLPQKVPGLDNVHFKQVNNSQTVLVATNNGRVERDSLLSGLSCQFTTSNNHLFYSASIRKSRSVKNNPGRYNQLLDKLNFSKGLVTINEKQAYFKDNNECYFLDEQAGSITALPEITGHSLKLQFSVEDVFIYVDDLYRIYTYKNGILQKELTLTGKLRQLLVQAAGVDPDPVMASLKIRRDGNHTLLACRDTFYLIQITNNVLDCRILAANAPVKDIKCMVYDEGSETLFIGTITSGLYVLKLHEFERLFFAPHQFMVNSQFAQIELPGGSVLTTTGILNRHNKGNLLYPGTHDSDKVAMLKATDGTIWYCENDSLKRTDVQRRTTSAIKYIGDMLTGIIESENKEIIYSTPNKLCLRQGKRDTILLDNPPLFQGADIQTIREISRNIIWVGTSKGLFAYDLSRHLLSKLPSLNTVSVAVIHIARDSSIWIGTYGQGFYKFYKNNFIRMPADTRKSLAIVHCLLEDRQGYFWIPTNKGLFRVTKKELDNYAGGNPEPVYYYYIDKSYGFGSNEFNGRCTPCGIKMDDGRFSFPSLDGLVQFIPDSVHLPLPDKGIFIDLITSDGKSSPLKDKLEESQDSNRLVFDICSPYFGSKINLRPEYAIKEIDSTWYPVDEDGRLTLTKLPKGVYTLVVRKQDSYAHYTYKTIGLTILPYWYETVWFRLLSGGLAIGVFLVFFRIRYNSQVKRAELLEQKVAVRTEQLSESNRVKELMIAAILHDLRSPLRFLHILAQRMYNKYKTTTELSGILFQFQNATNDLYDFTQDFFVFTNMQKEGFVINGERIVLRKIVNDIISFYEVGANIQKNIFINRVPEDIILHTDAGLLTMVIRNLADNANKYTDGGEIMIEATQDMSATRIIITDTGTSMNRELAMRIQNKTYNPVENGHGWGYKIIIEIMTRLGGAIAIDTNDGKGNKITITFAKMR